MHNHGHTCTGACHTSSKDRYTARLLKLSSYIYGSAITFICIQQEMHSGEKGFPQEGECLTWSHSAAVQVASYSGIQGCSAFRDGAPHTCIAEIGLYTWVVLQ